MGSLLFASCSLLGGQLLHSGIEAGLAPCGIVLLDDILLGGLVEGLLRLLEPFLGAGDIGFGDRFARAFDRRLDHALDGAVTERVLGGDPHVLLG